MRLKNELIKSIFWGKKNKTLLFQKSKFTINKVYFLNIFVRKGLFFRILNLNNCLVGKHVGSYLNSRKPNTRFFKKKR